MSTIRILSIGDIVGDAGRTVIRELVPAIKKEENIDFVIANGENIAGGSGITQNTAKALFRAEVDVVTAGDHVYRQKDIYELFKKTSRVLRPANFPDACPGEGYHVYKYNDEVSIAVVSLLGRVFMQAVDCPFKKAEMIVEKIKDEADVIVLDFHAEATSEKIAMGWLLDGKVSLITGSHTHVQTADEKVLPNGTAYISDLGMTGPFKSVLGREIEPILRRFKTQMPVRMPVAKEDLRINGVITEIDTKTGKALSIKRVERKYES